MKIKELEQEVKDGLYDDNSLIDLVLYYKKEIELLEKENKEVYNKIKKVKQLLEVDTYVENIYLGLCYLFGEYDYEDLPTKIKKVLDNEKE